MAEGREWIKGFEETQRCSGHCCRSFHLPFGPPEIDFHRRAFEKGVRKWKDIDKVAAMVIFRYSRHQKGGMRFLYTCKFLNRKTGDCENYEGRPAMCKDFPYKASGFKPDGSCVAFKGCTMRGVCAVVGEKDDKK